jgi:hypothetical protein
MTPSEKYLQQRLAAQGWAPIHDRAADFLDPGIGRFHLDFAAWQRQPDMLRRMFPRSAIYRAKTEAFGELLILSMSPLILAERISMILGGAVEIVEAATQKAQTVAAAVPVTSDKLALVHVGVATKEPPRACRQCGNVSGGGTCLAAQRGELEGAPRDYRPDPSVPRRCLAYTWPRPDRDEYLGRDQRNGRQLWPEIAALAEKPSEPAQVPEVRAADEGASAIDKARALVSSMLASGPLAASEILTATEGANISERTTQRAAEQLHVVKTKDGSGGWTWALPEAEPATAE